ncbi:MAG TPA: sodium:calcium antiporter [Bacillota bacterium]|nr:sodium:calcium antiporter [Bacillota bacterium]
MILTIAVLVISAVLIYISCEYFVNGIEWVGRRFNLSQSVVGTILAAFGTALPECIVTFVAVVFGANVNQKDIGVGAALGGPLVLSTVAYAVVGWGIYLFRRKRAAGSHLDIDGKKLSYDQLWFLSIFVFKMALGFVAFTGKTWTGLLFLAAYGIYVYQEMFRANDDSEYMELEPLKLRPRQETPETSYILIQTVGALAFIFLGSHLFVTRLELLSLNLGVPAHIVALLLSPIATELPEILNAVIWIRQGKERLALANISGAMMIQATVPSALGILFTPWLFDRSLALAGIVTIVSILFLWNTLRHNKLSVKRLSFAGVFYLVFALIFSIMGR